MKIIDDMIGEYIYISTMIYPPTAIWYYNKTVQKSEPIKDFVAYTKSILNQLKLEDELGYFDYINNNADKVTEIVINENGIVKFSIRS